MSTNPNNAVGTNAAYDGRTSVKAFNDGIGAYSRGILSGWACVPDTGMTVSLGGDGNTRDVAIAQDSGGNKTTINNISESPINVTLSAAPASNSRIDSIVAYVDNPPQGSATVIDNPAACGLIAVKGTVASTPVAPNESAIRAAITADGASGATAYYVVLANITIANGTTDLTSDDIQAGDSAGIGSNNIDFSTMAYKEVSEGKLQLTCDETGVYFIFGSANFNDDSKLLLDLSVGGVNVQSVAIYQSGDNHWRNWTMACIQPITAGQTIEIKDGNSVISAQAAGRASLCMFRVA